MTDNYTVTARKFRPQTFDQIVGQPHIVRTLTNALTKGRIAHAYLFSGTRGVGKTTSARILAKALNCEKGPTPSPCQECGNCKEIAAGQSVDVQEIDGASNTGVDNIRELRENARFTPTKSRYKIYIIDEVHQISKAAFNALLKTLEEPPPHVVFIFATTELSKVPDTILSRCQSFEYRSIGQSDIAAQLSMIAQREGIDVTPGAVELVARRARGSMRDAQTLFDQTAAYGGGKVDEDEVKLILGLVDRGLVLETLSALAEGKPAELIRAVADVTRAGADPTLFAEELAEATRDLLVATVDSTRLAHVEPAERERLVTLASGLEREELVRWFDLLTDTMGQMRFSHNPAMNLEMGLLKIADRRPVTDIDQLLDRVERATAHVERQVEPAVADAARAGVVRGSVPPLSGKKVAVAPATPPVLPKPLAPVAPPVNDDDGSIPEADFEIVETVEKKAPADLVAAFKKEKPFLMGIFDSAELHMAGEAVSITVKNLYDREMLETDRDTLEKIAGRHMGRRTRVVVKLKDSERPPEVVAEVREERQRADADLKGKIVDLPIIQDAIELFDGQVVDVRINRRDQNPS
ncbi:MAG: DNA polymerase III subunit gamma/tau [Nitrospinae bacterium]|nr:DNA polymerase III subunit gamma/tau [Nitrospinota bacterium]